MQSLTDPNQLAAPQRVRRKRFTAQQREQFVRGYLESGLTQEQFAAREGMSKSALARWLSNQRGRAAGLKAPVTFQELPLPALRPAWAVEVTNPQNWTLRLAQVPTPAFLEQLVGVLPC